MDLCAMPSSASRALFVFSAPTYYLEMLPVAEHYQRRGYEIHVVIGFLGTTADDAARECGASGMIVHRGPADLAYADHLARTRANPTAETSTPHPHDGPALGKGRATPPLPRRSARTLVALLKRNVHLRHWTRDLVDDVRPAVVFGGPYQSCGQIDNGLAREVRRRRVPYCCLAVYAHLGERDAIEARFSNVALGMARTVPLDADRNRVNKVLAWLLPGWIRSRDGVRLFMFHPDAMIAARLTGLMDRNPWRKPSDLYDVVFVESEFSREMLAASGYDQRKIVVGGKPRLDRVFARLSDAEYRSALWHSLGLADGESFLLCNVEPSAEHHYTSWEEHWHRFALVMESLLAVERKVVLSLHPMCDPARYRFVEAKYGFKVAIEHSIMDLYPYCEAVVSFPCSTNVLSPVFGKPLVIYDFLGFTKDDAPRSDLYRIPGALYAYDREELMAGLEKALGLASVSRGVANEGPSLSACEAIANHVRRHFGV